MKRLGQYILFAWMAFSFVLGFLLILPALLIIIPRPAWHKYYFGLSRVWSNLFFLSIGMWVKVEGRKGLNTKQNYIYCANHFSYLDIPLLTQTVPHFTIFVGLHNLAQIPVFGYMYRKIHIIVDRSSLKDRYATFRKSKEALKAGKSLAIFPEGGIWTEDFPALSPFKDGPFRIAIEEQKDIVPVTLPYDWKMIPVFDYHRLKWHRQMVIFHPPISTQGMSLEDLPKLKQKVYEMIDQKLRELNP